MQFKQSIRDFPQMVKLGEETPSFAFNRFKQGLQFVPVDDGGFSLRVDRQRLEYQGRRRSHRFTILGDTAFEYDCILKREPDSNVIRLRIEGAEHFDFFRQPDFVKEPFLQGSYAVYKKQTLMGEGTGKLCHIHRPEIIDARGRRCWGSLAVVGNELQITIPEQWLSEAAYPVVVDPVIGSAAVGSQYEYYVSIYGYMPLWCIDSILLNKVLISERIDTNGTFYVYKNEDFGEEYRIIDTCPCMYNNVNNLPNTRISVNEELIIDPYDYNEAGWLHAGIGKNYPINEGDYIWFGVRGNNLQIRFDYGGILESYDAWGPNYYEHKLVPDYLWDNSYTQSLTTHLIREIKASMYINFELQGNNHITTLVETVRVNSNLSKAQTFFRRGAETVRINMALNASFVIAKICHVIDSVRVNTKIFSSKVVLIKLTDLLKAEGSVIRKLFISLRIVTNSFVRSYFNKRFLNSRIEIILKSRIGESNRSEQ